MNVVNVLQIVTYEIRALSVDALTRVYRRLRLEQGGRARRSGWPDAGSEIEPGRMALADPGGVRSGAPRAARPPRRTAPPVGVLDAPETVVYGRRRALGGPAAHPRPDLERTMRIGESLLPEFEQEMATTRRVLERVPGERGTWKPHPRSFALGHLAQLVSWMPGWIATTLRQPRLDLAAAAGYSFETTETLLAGFDRNVGDAREALASSADADYDQPWSLVHGERVLFTAPRRVIVRNHISHLIHHRGQLTVYLRLNEVPVPSIYGPTADEPW
jgi:uncharacterized damage-inducible protein DinB